MSARGNAQTHTRAHTKPYARRRFNDLTRDVMCAACIYHAFEEIGAPRALAEFCSTLGVKRGQNMRVFTKYLDIVLEARAKATNTMRVSKVRPEQCVGRIISALDKENVPLRLRGATLDVLETPAAEALPEPPLAVAAAAVAVALVRLDGSSSLVDAVKRVASESGLPLPGIRSAATSLFNVQNNA